MEQQTGAFAVKRGLAQMLKGGVIMDVVTPEHARIADDAVWRGWCLRWMRLVVFRISFDKNLII